MRTAECNVCGEKWEIVDEIGMDRPRRLRLEGRHDDYRGYMNADLCSLECVIVWARMKQKEVRAQ